MINLTQRILLDDQKVETAEHRGEFEKIWYSRNGNHKNGHSPSWYPLGYS